MNYSVCHYAFSLLAFLFSGAEITHTLVLAYRNSRSIFAHSACKYNPEIVCAGENGTQKSANGRYYFNLDIDHWDLKDWKQISHILFQVVTYIPVLFMQHARESDFLTDHGMQIACPWCNHMTKIWIQN